MKEKRTLGRKIPFFYSIQVKYVMSYFAMLTVVLVLLNTYPVLAAQSLLFQSKQESLRDQIKVMSSALMELEQLSEENVHRVMDMLDTTEVDRVLVVNPSGLVLYDSQLSRGKKDKDTAETQPKYALWKEIVRALDGSDVSYSRYVEGAFLSTATSPIIYRGMPIGAVYFQDLDREQGALLLDLQENLRNISGVIAVIALLMSVLFSKMLTSRMGALLGAIRIVGEGEYGHRLEPVGRDELAHLAKEFNELTDRLQTVEEVRRRFISDASHELKTPLASICLLTDSILQSEEMDKETVQDFVSDIGQEAWRLTRITEHLLTLSRLDSLPIQETLGVGLKEISDRVLSILAPVAEESGVTLEQGINPQHLVRCNPDDLHQICFNLVENAIKYNHLGGRVHLVSYEESQQIILEVQDTGMGIPTEDISKVFNRFYRVDQARSREAGGTGLGLAIVRDTVRRHGGWVSATSSPSEGSVFTVGLSKYIETDYESEDVL